MKAATVSIFSVKMAVWLIYLWCLEMTQFKNKAGLRSQGEATGFHVGKS